MFWVSDMNLYYTQPAPARTSQGLAQLPIRISSSILYAHSLGKCPAAKTKGAPFNTTCLISYCPFVRNQEIPRCSAFRHLRQVRFPASDCMRTTIYLADSDFNDHQEGNVVGVATTTISVNGRVRNTFAEIGDCHELPNFGDGQERSYRTIGRSHQTRWWTVLCRVT